VAVHRAEDFFTVWTRKEAVLKALGTGLRTPMTDVVVTTPERDPALLKLRGASPPACRMAQVRAPKGYLGAVAVLGSPAVAFTVTSATRLLDGLEVGATTARF
jgi:4'-phosphopantetheinyl transferase